MNELVSKLCRAELITHLLEIDQDAMPETEAAACVLELLDAQVFRIAPFLYGVNLSSLSDATDEERVDAISGALTARMGPDSVGVTTLVLEAPAIGATENDVEENTLLLMQAVATAADHPHQDNNNEVRAMMSAEFAVRAAELTAKGLAELALPVQASGADLAPAIEAATDALGALELRLDHLEQRIGEIAQSSQQDMQDWADAALLVPMKDLASNLKAIGRATSDGAAEWGQQIGARLEALERGQIPVEWFLGKIMSRIGDLDEHLAGNDREQRDSTLELAQRLDDRLSAVSDQMIPPEWLLGRIMTRIGELDQQFTGAQRQVESATIGWGERLDQRVDAMSSQMAPPEWLLGRILSRIDELEDRFTSDRSAPQPEPDFECIVAEIRGNLQPFGESLTHIEDRLTVLETQGETTRNDESTTSGSEIAASHKQMKKSLATVKGQITAMNKRQEQSSKEVAVSLELIRGALAEILARSGAK